MIGAKFSEIYVLLFLAGTAFGEINVRLFVAGIAFGAVHVSLFVAGAAFGEIWHDNRSRKYYNYFSNLLLGSAESSLGGAAGSVLRCLGRIGLKSFPDRSRIGNATSAVFNKFLKN